MNDIEWQRPDLRPHIKRISAAAGWRWRQRFSPRGALRRRVAGQVVLITGASSGIGAGLSHRLARAGATVLLIPSAAWFLLSFCFPGPLCLVPALLLFP